ncbi:MAG TPA: S-layer homology domain-containing protein [Egibacteraceae bacterium]|jgi:hypothetical protein|nr:S-layer homology domain-containing protein [Egibacteraceae bacterium]
MRRTLLIAFMSAMTLSLTGTALATHVFSDVGEDHPHELGIRFAAERGVVRGFSDGTFRPNRPVTRGQVASMLLRDFTGPSYTLTPVCGTTEFFVVEHARIGSGEATVTFSVDGGPRTRIAGVPSDSAPLRFDAGSPGIVSIFVDDIAWAHAPTAERCT